MRKSNECNRWAEARRERCLDDLTAQDLRSNVLRLRGSMGTLYDFADQPVNFAFVQFVIILTTVFLPVHAFQASLLAGVGESAYWLAEIFYGLSVVVQGIYLVGLRILADRLSDPYGDDVEDLSVLTYVDTTWILSRRMVESSQTPVQPPDPAQEDAMVQDEKSLGGPAWIPPTPREWLQPPPHPTTNAPSPRVSLIAPPDVNPRPPKPWRRQSRK